MQKPFADKGSPPSKGVPYLNGGLPAQSSLGDVSAGLDHPIGGEDLPSWLPQILLRLAKLEQRVDAKERSPGGGGGGGKTILSPLAPQASSSAPHGGGSNPESERRVVEVAREEAKNLANEIVEAALSSMQCMLDKAYKAAEEASAASASAAAGQESAGPSSDSQMRQVREHLQQSAARIAILDSQVQQLLAASSFTGGTNLSSSEQANANAIASLSLASLSNPPSANGGVDLIVAQTQAREAATKVEALTREVENLTKSVQRQQQSWSATLGDVNNMRAAVNAVTASSNTCSHELTAAQNHINSLVKLSEAMSNKQESMGRDVSELIKASMVAKNTVGPAGVPSGDMEGRLSTLESDLNQLAGFAGQVTGRVSVLEKDIVDTLSSYVRIVDLKESENHLLSRHDQLHDEIEVIKLDIDAIAGSLEGTVVQMVARAPKHANVYQRGNAAGQQYLPGGQQYLPGINGAARGQQPQEPAGPPPKLSLTYQNSMRPQRHTSDMGGKSMMRRVP